MKIQHQQKLTMGKHYQHGRCHCPWVSWCGVARLVAEEQAGEMGRVRGVCQGDMVCVGGWSIYTLLF